MGNGKLLETANVRDNGVRDSQSFFYTNPYTKTRGNVKSFDIANVRDSGQSR